MLTLPALTCLVGRNSSGKSSIIHALLVLRQSVEQRAAGSRLPQLNLNGPLIDAGSFEEIVHNHDVGRALGFTFHLEVDTSQTRRYRYMHTSPLVALDVPRPEGRRVWSPFSAWLSAADSRGSKSREVTVAMSFQPEAPFGPTLSRLVINVEGVGEASFVRTAGERRVQHWRVYSASLSPRAMAIDFSSWGFFPFVRVRQGRLRKATTTKRRHVSQFVTAAQVAFFEMETYLRGLRILGPFRTPPARRYAFTGMGAVDAGTTGERAVDLLITEKLIRTPGQPLRLAVSYWLKRLALAKHVVIRDLAKKSNIFELSVAGAGTARAANFADVGFGISQVLPVLVQGFLVPRGGTYIVQQPELHLHPDAQAGLADYFLYLASQGVNCLIETHSEYLLLRLRRRLAEGIRNVRVGMAGSEEARPRRLGKDDVSIVFVGDGAGGVARLEPLEIGDGFQFENLPPGFMSQSITDRIALMKALKRR